MVAILSNGDTQTLSASVAFTVAAGEQLYVFAWDYDGFQTITVGWNGAGLTQHARVGSRAFFYSLAPLPGTGLIDIVLNVPRWIRGIAWTGTGKDFAQATLTAGGSGIGTNVTSAVGSAPGQFVWDFIVAEAFDATGPVLKTVGALQTVIGDEVNASSKFAAAASEEPGASSVTMSWTLDQSSFFGQVRLAGIRTASISPPPGGPPACVAGSARVPVGYGWVPFCSPGTGVVDSYPVVSPPSMANIRDPRTYIRFDFKEIDINETQTVMPEWWALDATIPDPQTFRGGPKDARVTSVGNITRGMADEAGTYVGSRVVVAANDRDRASLRTRMDSPGRYVWHREGQVYVTSEAARRAQTDHREIFRGLTVDINVDPGFNAGLVLEDKILSQLGRFAADRTFSTRLFPKGMLPGLAQGLAEKPIQWIFGEVSDRGARDPVTGQLAEKGMVPIWLVGARTINGTLYDEYHIAGHAIKLFELFGSDLAATNPTRVRLDLNAMGASGEVIAPFYPGWPLTETYLDILNPLSAGGDGRIHRVTHFFMKSSNAVSLAHRCGTVPMAANVCGVEDVGDGTGNLITDLFPIYQFIFEHILLPDLEYHTGLYTGSPLWSDGRSMVDSDSFGACQSLSVNRVGGRGYQGSFMLCGPKEGVVPLKEIMRRMMISSGCSFAWSGGGQLKCILLDENQSLSAIPVLREPSDLREWVTVRYAWEEVENPVLFVYDYDDEASRWRVDTERAVDVVAWTRLGPERPSPEPVGMRCLRDAVTARDVAQRRLLSRKYPPAYYTLENPIDGLDHDPGDIVRFVSAGDIGDGLQTRAVQLRTSTYNTKTKRTTLIGRDVLSFGGLVVSSAHQGQLLADANPNVALLLADSDPNVMLLT